MSGSPIIDGRDRAQILADLIARAPAYVPEWSIAQDTPAYALLAILARGVEIQAAAENGMPDGARLGFLSTLGNSLLSAQSARTPLVFQLMPNAPLDVTLAGDSPVAAKLPPPPPSLLGSAQATPPAPIFSTEGTITLTRAKLTALYSVDPNADTYADHTTALTSGFTLFDQMQPVPHQLCLGHDSLFAISANAEIELSFDLGATHAKNAPPPMLIDWEYLSADGWLPLRTVSDRTARLTQDGRITLHLDCGPDADKGKVNGIESYWLRGTVSTRVPSGTIGPLPGGYSITWSESKPIHDAAASLTPLTIAGTPTTPDGVPNQAIITKVQRSTITLNKSLFGAQVGASVVTAGANTFVGRIAGRVGGVTLVLEGIDPGRAITIPAPGANTAMVIGELNGTAVLDQPLVGAAAKAALNDAETGDPVGTLDGFDPDFLVPLDSAADFLKGDAVTVDATTHATITAVTATSVSLDGSISAVSQGNQLTLLNALPVLRPEGASATGSLPSVDIIRARVGFTKSNLKPDAAATDTSPLDTGNAFYPFGRQPQKFTTFYIASKEVFQRQGAQVDIVVTLAQTGATFNDNDMAVPNAMLWTVEYYNGDGWLPLGGGQKLADETHTMTVAGPANISFLCPADWADTKVNGQSNKWLRIRIDAGNYGHPLRLTVDNTVSPPLVKSDPATLQPPVVASLRLQYTYLTNSDLLDHCVSYNDFAYIDHSEDVRWPRRPFQPFTPVNDTQPAVHFGFSALLPPGLVSLYFAAGNRSDGPSGGAPTSSPFLWEYYSPRGWIELAVLDESDGFTGSGLIQFVGPPDAIPLLGLRDTPYWLRARLKPELPVQTLPATGLWLNAVWAHQGETVQQDLLGSSNGNPGQTFVFAPQHVPVLPGEVVEVREWQGRGEYWQTAAAGVPQSDLRFVVDPSDGKTITEVWVTWHWQPYFYLSGPNDRHYVLERASGALQFPTPPYGMIPPGGASIAASYATGGGLSGNVPANTITELHSAASYVQSVTNPFPATGGSATELTPRARDRATQRLRHRDRALAPADFEWLAREASPEVARARCLPITGPDGTGERGWITLVVIPGSVDPAPMPTPGLLAEVAAELEARVPAAIVGQIVLAPPTYTPVGVRADIVPHHADEAALVEARLRERLTAFLHPLTGGSAGTGWDFGQPVYLSQIAALVEQTEGVDFVPLLQLIVDDGVAGDMVAISSGALVTQGDHQLKLMAEET
ncbi:MAG: putative baseplate assembly protein [Alphaproteobacteria bacterium]|nr:putative baseplate assembly protein [Alphaproteobacteria bacterium]